MIFVGWQAYLSFAFILFLLLPGGYLRQPWRVGLLLVIFLVGLVPLPWGLSAAGYLRGLTDDLAITSMVWMAFAVLARLGCLAPGTQSVRWPLCLTLAVMGLVLYPAALGLGMLDTYGWGYSPRWLILLVGLVTLGLLLLGNALGVCMFVLATLAFVLDLKPSGNYWDYLLDPFIVLYALAVLLYGLVAGLYGWAKGLLGAPAQLDEQQG